MRIGNIEGTRKEFDGLFKLTNMNQLYYRSRIDIFLNKHWVVEQIIEGILISIGIIIGYLLMELLF
jgi:hypothetical protein